MKTIREIALKIAKDYSGYLGHVNVECVPEFAESVLAEYLAQQDFGSAGFYYMDDNGDYQKAYDLTLGTVHLEELFYNVKNIATPDHRRNAACSGGAD